MSLDVEDEDFLLIADEEVLGEIEDRESQHPVERLTVFEEHDSLWAECVECGRQWKVSETESETEDAGLDLEVVTQGDGYCDENPAEEI